MSIHTKLPLFAKEDILYKELIGDPSRPHLTPETNINDYNSGSIENALRWHIEYQKRIVTESTLANATGHNLNLWGSFYGIARPLGMSDADYIALIISTVTATVATAPIVFNLFPDPPDAYKYKSNLMSMFLDYSFLDAGVLNPANINPARSSILTSGKGAIYVLVPNMSIITTSIIIKLKSILGAGSAVYVGVFTP